MEYLRKLFRLGLYCILIGVPCFAWADIDFSIRYYDKKIYYPESDIELKVALRNNSPEVYRFRLSDNRAFSVDFDVRNMANQPVPAYPKFSIDRNSNQPVFFREVAVEPGEEFSFMLNLKDFVKIDSSGTYTVQARFYPGLFTAAAGSGFKTSNILTLSVRPSAAGMQAVKDKIDFETGEILKANPLPPDEVVAYFINARQRGEWEKFFLYLNVESLYRNSPQGARSYRNMSEVQRIEALSRYREDLKNRTIDSDITLIPQDFEMVKTSYTSREATVEILQMYDYPGYREKKLFTYYLSRSDAVWSIYNYNVQNRGTEALRR
ncbi:MAG: hypothetical protein LBC67_00695 [Spirochaetales bacterium]|jgi:hypothetical protein|nr:hypothetical protein [Spirochaetales bacterium]